MLNKYCVSWKYTRVPHNNNHHQHVVLQTAPEEPRPELVPTSLKKSAKFKGSSLDIIVLLMGFLDKLVSALGLRKKEANVLVVGLDNSGLLQCILKFLFQRINGRKINTSQPLQAGAGAERQHRPDCRLQC